MTWEKQLIPTVFLVTTLLKRPIYLFMVKNYTYSEFLVLFKKFSFLFTFFSFFVEKYSFHQCYKRNCALTNLTKLFSPVLQAKLEKKMYTFRRCDWRICRSLKAFRLSHRRNAVTKILTSIAIEMGLVFLFNFFVIHIFLIVNI